MARPKKPSKDMTAPSANRTFQRRAEDERYHALNTRLHVVETNIAHVQSVLLGQREATDTLVLVAQKNGREIEILHGLVGNIENSVVRAIAEHAAAEMHQRVKSTRFAFWTLLTVVVSLGVTLSLHMLDKVFLTGGA